MYVLLHSSDLEWLVTLCRWKRWNLENLPPSAEPVVAHYNIGKSLKKSSIVNEIFHLSSLFNFFLRCIAMHCKNAVHKRKRWSKRLRALQNNRRCNLISSRSAIFFFVFLNKILHQCEMEMVMLIWSARWVQLTAVSRVEEPVCLQPFRLQVCHPPNFSHLWPDFSKTSPDFSNLSPDIMSHVTRSQ